MRKFLNSFLAGAVGLALVAAGFAHSPNVSAQAASVFLIDGYGVSDGITAVSTDVGLYVKYVGAAQTGTATVAVAAGGDITLTVNGAGATDVKCPSGGSAGVIDVSDGDCNTMAEVVAVINKSTNWRAVYGGVIGTDSSNDTLITRSAVAASGPDGIALLKDTAVALNITLDLTPNFYAVAPGNTARTIQFFMAPQGANLGQKLNNDPYRGLRTWLAYATETITSSGTVGAFAVIGSRQVHRNQGSTSYQLTETNRTIVSSTGAATTVQKSYDFTNFPLASFPGERILVRISSGTDLTVPLVHAFGVMQKYNN